MWSCIGEEMGIPWGAAEAMHWHMGQEEIGRRARHSPPSLAVIDHGSPAQSDSSFSLQSVGQDKTSPSSPVNKGRPWRDELCNLSHISSPDQLSTLPSFSELVAGIATNLPLADKRGALFPVAASMDSLEPTARTSQPMRSVDRVSDC